MDKQGKVLWSATYNAYGEATVAQTGQGSIVSRLRFPGQIEDEESGLYYNWHRYYDFRAGGYDRG